MYKLLLKVKEKRTFQKLEPWKIYITSDMKFKEINFGEEGLPIIRFG